MNPAPSSPNLLLIRTALQWQKEAARQHPDLKPAVWRVSHCAARTLLTWRAPRLTVLAALLYPFLHLGIESPRRLEQQFGAAALDLASRTFEWHQWSRSFTPELMSDQLERVFSFRLRRLFRQAYLDLPGLEFILLLLAQQDALLRSILAQPAQVNLPLILQETQSVFIPLAQMLGMWQLHLQWREICADLQAQIDPALRQNLASIRAETGSSGEYSADQFAALVNRKRQLEARSHSLSAEERAWLSSRRFFLEKAQAYLEVESQLQQAFGEAGLTPPPRVQPRPLLASHVLRSIEEGASREEKVRQLGLHIFCHSRLDCYQALGIVHQLGKPVAPRYSERFDDYIAAPQPNCYRALHTAMMYETTYGKIMLEVRILTPEMHFLNEYGVAAALHLAPQRYAGVPAWWNSQPRLSQEIERKNPSSPTPNLVDFLQKNDLNTLSDPLYVFSPRGEIILLEKGSTPLDYAYQIHTQLGHHAWRMRVNERLFLHHTHYPLRNGDLVQVQYDPRSPGPDFSWLNLVRSAKARSKIKSELVRRARQVHEGRNTLQEAFHKAVQYYQRQRSYDLVITGTQLDAFLARFARRSRLPDVNRLYEEVESGRISAERVVQSYISEEFSSLVVDADGRRLTIPVYRLAFCHTCRPLPGDEIIGLEQNRGSVLRKLTVHRKGSQFCLQSAPTSRRVALGWVETPAHDQEEVVSFDIQAEDHPRLTEDLLQPVYNAPGCTLVGVEAKSFMDGSAWISLHVSAANPAALHQIQDGLNAVHHVRHVISFPASPTRRAAAPQQAFFTNPYMEYEVFDRLNFFDRESQLETIMHWLRQPQGAPWLILHGQGRVGKTSLARYVLHEELANDPLAFPVYVNLQSLSYFKPASIAQFFAEAVFHELALPFTPPQSWQEPFAWLQQALETALQALKGTPLLLIVDEFNILLNLERERFDPVVFANLEALMRRLADVRWLLISQDNEYQDRERWGGAADLFSKALEVELTHLDAAWASKLILEPLQRCGLHYSQPDLPDRIFFLTAGNPFLIKVICYQLVERARKQRLKRITPSDLERVVQYVLSDGRRYFQHFLEVLHTPRRRLALAAYLHLSAERDPVEEQALLSLLQSRADLVPETSLQTLEELQRQGILKLETNPAAPSSRCISMPIDLFKQWCRQQYDFDDCCQDWNAS